MFFFHEVNRGEFFTIMNATLKRIFVFGFPGMYGGAATEMHHQIILWLDMGVEVHLIPAWNPQCEELLPVMEERGVIIHEPLEWGAMRSEDAIFGFCSELYLSYLPEIRHYTRRTVFINCMTCVFGEEKRAMRDGEVALFLFQNEEVRSDLQPQLQAINPDPTIRFMSFRPYFHEEEFPFHSERNRDVFCCGHISRSDRDKYARETLAIYEGVRSPLPKKGIFLGFGALVEEKTGKPPSWIRTARNHYELPVTDFYQECDVVLQPSDLTENWPRVGLEAMASGSVLIVDNRGGWKQMVEHEKTGWLCDSVKDFIKYASLMAKEPELCMEMAKAARERGRLLAGKETGRKSWEAVFEEVTRLKT
ncbi:glycosyltransferase [Akkermansia sp.]|uniref:glycosyltransferase n=1 Tax=Akkermansia sp. TaxID=1872421 RepID=UPI003AB5893A